MIVAVGIGLASLSAAAEDVPAVTLEQAQAMERDCLDQLIGGTGAVECAFPTYMEERERAALAKITRGELEDARCMIKVKLGRDVVDAVVNTIDGRVTVPAQSVACTLVLKAGSKPVTFSFKPVLDFKGGSAIAAHPGMGEVTGVSSWLSWPVVTYVNANTDLRKIMLRVVNAYIERQRVVPAAP